MGDLSEHQALVPQTVPCRRHNNEQWQTSLNCWQCTATICCCSLTFGGRHSTVCGCGLSFGGCSPTVHAHFLVGNQLFVNAT